VFEADSPKPGGRFRVLRDDAAPCALVCTPASWLGLVLPPASYAATWANVGACVPKPSALFCVSSVFPLTVEWRPLAFYRESVTQVARVE
jgi:hypothetical protein